MKPVFKSDSTMDHIIIYYIILYYIILYYIILYYIILYYIILYYISNIKPISKMLKIGYCNLLKNMTKDSLLNA